jgi:hypothetical protein
MGRIDRGKNARPVQDAADAEKGNRRKPDEHDRTECLADARRASALHREQSEQNDHRHRHNMRLEDLGRLVETLKRAQHRDRRRDDAVAIDQGCPEQAHDDERPAASVPARPGE